MPDQLEIDQCHVFIPKLPLAALYSTKTFQGKKSTSGGEGHSFIHWWKLEVIKRNRASCLDWLSPTFPSEMEDTTKKQYYTSDAIVV